MSVDATYRFRLYIAGEAENSTHALTNLSTICKRCLPNRHNIEVIDVFKEPGRAFSDRIFMTPMLVKMEPAPKRWIVGTLSDEHVVLKALGLSVPVT
jgi:circadian clock protein KaiB